MHIWYSLQPPGCSPVWVSYPAAPPRAPCVGLAVGAEVAEDPQPFVLRHSRAHCSSAVCFSGGLVVVDGAFDVVVVDGPCGAAPPPSGPVGFCFSSACDATINPHMIMIAASTNVLEVFMALPFKATANSCRHVARITCRGRREDVQIQFLRHHYHHHHYHRSRGMLSPPLSRWMLSPHLCPLSSSYWNQEEVWLSGPALKGHCRQSQFSPRRRVVGW